MKTHAFLPDKHSAGANHAPLVLVRRSALDELAAAEVDGIEDLVGLGRGLDEGVRASGFHREGKASREASAEGWRRVSVGAASVTRLSDGEDKVVVVWGEEGKKAERGPGRRAGERRNRADLDGWRGQASSGDDGDGELRARQGPNDFIVAGGGDRLMRERGEESESDQVAVRLERSFPFRFSFVSFRFVSFRSFDSASLSLGALSARGLARESVGSTRHRTDFARSVS